MKVHAESTPNPATPNDDELIESLTRHLTLSIEEVADWHYLDEALWADRDGPLVRLLTGLILPRPSEMVDIRDSQTSPTEGPVLAAV